MKKHFVLMLLSFGFLFSCSKLDETVYSSIAQTNFYKTASDAEAGLTSVYSSFADMYSGPSMVLVPDFSADQVYPRPVVGRNTLTMFNYDANYTTQRSFNRTLESPLDIWQHTYTGIERANWVISKVPGVAMNASRRDQIVGEALFLRALFYFTLARNFGDVPVKTTPTLNETDAFTAKSARADVYRQIYEDLDKAAGFLPAYSASIPKGRPSKEAAMALHAKAALYDEKWDVALQKAQQVISSGRYSLIPEVKDLYDVAREAAARQEVLFAFEAESTAGGRNGQIMSLYGPRNSDGPQYGKTTFGSIFAYQKFFNSFNPLDKRRQLLDTNYVNGQGRVVPQRDITPITTEGVLVKKYMDPNSNGANGANNVPVLRLADVYLVAAEAEARLNGPSGSAYNNINIVRRRAGLGDLTPGLSRDAFVDSVLQERSWEFFGEGDRWYDLTRTGKFLAVIPTAINSVFPVRTPLAKHRFFPLPQDEVNANPKLEQNPDWR
ncbi:RagB/SusD family nutrient uptake outer membrane protein [Flaviaesturariibacter amylovorans]|uniref:RagB/SusD family nutrient uptake outer membrane protein n=1 Tax=Flaviaesturariibacter amylovorans TaxID=1084520 RepID=A0ABP8HS83_9BACT